jgi:adenylate cyclase
VRSVGCTKSIIDVIKKEINLVLNEKYGYPKLLVKIGIDEGENAVIQYGYEKNSPIDILGYSMNIASKITSLTSPNSISLGKMCIVYWIENYSQNFKSYQYLPITGIS